MKSNINKFLTAIVLSLALFGCEKTSDVTIVASRHEMILGEYFDANGVLTTKKWEASDEVAVLRINEGNVEKAVAVPIMEGRKEGLFMFNFEGYAQNSEIVAFYPSDAPVTSEGKSFKVDVPQVQDGSFNMLFIGTCISNGSSFLDKDLELKPYWHTFHVSLSKGDYSISKAEFKSQEQNISVKFEKELDCRKSSQKFYINLPPIHLKGGYSITFTTSDGKSFNVDKHSEIVLEEGGKTDITNAKFPANLVVCGDNKLYIINADKAIESGFESAIIWEWDAKTVQSIVGADMIRLDDCKVVDGGTKILATSSRSWAVLLDIATKELLWWSYSSKNAHSADLLPGGKIAVACSSSESGDGNKVQIFDVKESNKELFSTPLESAHGVVWNETDQRLYAIGGSKLNVYTLSGSSTNSPTLTLEKTIDTSSRVTGLHDLTLVNPTTLLIAGRKAALYDLTKNIFTPLPHFSESIGIKSVNYNHTTGDCWYTDATDPNNTAGYDWATKNIFYTSNIAYTTIEKKITVPEGYNMYKVRVMNW